MEYIYKGVFPTRKAIIGHFKNDLEPQALSVCNCASKAKLRRIPSLKAQYE